MNKKSMAILLIATVAALMQIPALAAGGDVGEPAPDFTLKDVRGVSYTLSDYQGKVVVLEWINPGCPFSMRHTTSKTMIDLSHRFDKVVWLGINSTDQSHKDFLDAQAHRALNQGLGIDYAVLLDPTGETGHAYHAKTTPHLFVIDEKGVVIYNGAIDNDAYGNKRSPTNYVEVALESHEAGEAPDPATSKPYGCSVKYGK